jgi:hypothetical protein
MWWKGPWTMRMIPLMWPVVGCALLTWGAVAYRRWRAGHRVGQGATPRDDQAGVERRAA